MGCNQSKDPLKDKILREHGRFQPTAENKSMCPYLNGTAFADKPESTLQISNIVGNADGSEEANFNWGVRVNYATDADEVHFQVMDKDLVTEDDFLGEFRISVGDLKAQTNNEFKKFPLNTQGQLELLTGTYVQDMVISAAPKEDSMHSDFMHWVSSVQSVFEVDQMTGEAIYWKNQALFAIAGKSSDCNGMVRFFTPRTTYNGVNTYEWKDGYFPEHCSVHTGYADVVNKLKNMGEEYGTNDNNGKVYRQNFLGNQRLTGFNWPELKEAGYTPGIGLSQSQELHAWIRPLLVAIVGPDSPHWNPGMVRTWVREFWQKETVSKGDFGVFVMRILHKVMFNIDMTEEEGADFCKMQFFLLISNGLFEFAHKSALILKKLKWMEHLEKKAKWIARYETALAEMPAFKALSPPATGRQMTLAASMFMDSILYAGGAGVPTALGFAFAIPYTAWGKKELPRNFRITKQNYKQYMQECMRRFPPVGNFALTRRNFTGNGEPDKLEFLAVGRAHNDPREWGAKQFQIRPMKVYDEKAFPFLDFANAPHLESPNSHSCPGKALATCILNNHLEAWIDTCGGKAVDLNQWVREPKKGEELPLKPLGMSEYGPDAFKLIRKTKIPATQFK